MRIFLLCFNLALRTYMLFILSCIGEFNIEKGEFNMEPEERKILPMTRVVDIRYIPEESKSITRNQKEPEIKNTLELGEYICKNKNSIPLEILKLTENKTDLTEINLKHIRLSLNGVKHLSVMLHFFKEVTFADFTDMMLNEKELEVLGPSLGRLLNLEELFFMANNLASGAQFLSEPLSFLTNLKILNIADCCLDGKAFGMICSGLCNLKQLQLLQLSMNPLGDLGAQELAKVIYQLPILIELELYSCEITDIGGKFLEQAFNKTMLESVLLGNNKFSQKFEGRLKGKYEYVHFGIKHYRCILF